MAQTDRHADDDKPIAIRFPRDQQDLLAWLNAQVVAGRSRSALVIEALAEKRAREQP